MEQVAFLIAFLVFAGHGYFANKGENIADAKAYALSTQGNRWFPVAAGISMTYCGGAATLNMAGVGYKYGWWGLIDPLAVFVGLVIVAVLADRYRQGHAVTMAGVLSGSDRPLTIFAGSVSAGVYVLLVSAQFVALGKLAAPLFPSTPLWVLIAIPSLVVCAYVFLNGFVAVNQTDILQFIVMIAFLSLPVLAVAYFHSPSVAPPVLPIAFSTMSTDLMILLAFSLIFVPVSQDIVIRVKAAASTPQAAIGMIVGGLAYVLFVGSSIFIGVQLAESGVHLGDPEQALPQYFMIHYPTVGAISLVAVLAAIISTLDAFLFSAIVLIENDILQHMPRIRDRPHTTQLKLATIIVYSAALLIALFFTQILGLILVGLLIYVSILAPMALSRYLGLKQAVITILGAATVTLITIVEGFSIDISPKPVLYPAFHVVLILAYALFVRLGGQEK